MKKTLCVAGVLLAVVGLGSLRFSNQCLNLDALQGKSEAQMDEADARKGQRRQTSSLLEFQRKRQNQHDHSAFRLYRLLTSITSSQIPSSMAGLGNTSASRIGPSHPLSSSCVRFVFASSLCHLWEALLKTRKKLLEAGRLRSRRRHIMGPALCHFDSCCVHQDQLF